MVIFQNRILNLKFRYKDQKSEIFSKKIPRLHDLIDKIAHFDLIYSLFCV